MLIRFFVVVVVLFVFIGEGIGELVKASAITLELIIAKPVEDLGSFFHDVGQLGLIEVLGVLVDLHSSLLEFVDCHVLTTNVCDPLLHIHAFNRVFRE